MVAALLHICIAQSVFAAILILTKKPLSVADKILSGWLFILLGIFLMSMFWRLFPDSVESNWLNPGVIIILFPPLIYLYAKYVTKKEDTFYVKDLIHILPLAFISVIVGNIGVKHNLFLFEQHEFSVHSFFWLIFRILIFSTIVVFYWRKTLGILKKYQKSIESLYSYHSKRINLQWLKILSIFANLLLLSSIPFMITMYFNIKLAHPGLVIMLGYTVFLYFISFMGYRQERLLVKEKTKAVPHSETKRNAYKTSGLNDSAIDQHVIKIQAAMKEKELWRNSNLTVNDLSISTKIPKHHITQALNQKLNKNFYTLVNEYRVEEVKRLFADDDYKNWDILSIAFECGFNSKSSFNTFFKKSTNTTPSQYRKSIV